MGTRRRQLCDVIQLVVHLGVGLWPLFFWADLCWRLGLLWLLLLLRCALLCPRHHEFMQIYGRDDGLLHGHCAVLKCFGELILLFDCVQFMNTYFVLDARNLVHVQARPLTYPDGPVVLLKSA